jgi:DNA-binding response OmpR family regulator
MAEHIVIAEDDEDLAFVLREALRRQRYEIEVSPPRGASSIASSRIPTV